MTKTLEKRVEKLEQELAELKSEIAQSRGTPRRQKDWTRTFGMFKDDPIYDEIVRLGAAYRRRQPKC